MRRFRFILLGGFLALSAAVHLAGIPTGSQDGGATFAMADIHGNYQALVELLSEVGLVGDDLGWTGGEATFIQTGDYTDRGPEVRRVMDLLMALEEDAPEGRVVILLGNHEVMNMMGDLRDLTDADYRSFSDEASEDRRRDALTEYLRFEARRLERLGLDDSGAASEEEWLSAHPPGFLERRDALSPDGDYGRWLRQRPVLVKHENTLFMHAGIHPDLPALSIDEINERVHQELRTFDTLIAYLADEGIILPYFTFSETVAAVRQELEASREGRIRIPDERVEILESFLGVGNWLSVHPEGVLWFRGFSQWSEEEGTPLMEGLLERYDADHFVVGHTPQEGGRIRSRFGGRLFLADTGMLSSYYRGGRPSILKIQNGAFESIYLNSSAAPEPAGTGDRD